jgi:pimeloyl-ACP methyl ester carboxylesterase
LDEIKYIEKGNSTNYLFLVHGFCSGPEDWIDQINFFSNKYTVIAPMLRGHDGQNYNNRPMSIEQLSNDCVNILKKKKINNVIIAGHSMGTRLAIDLANKIKNCSGLILVDGSRFSDYNSYFKTLEVFENSIQERTYLSVLKNMFSSMFFSKIFDNHKDRIIKRAIKIPECFSLPLRRNAIWYDSHCVETNLNNLSLPILILHSTKLDKKMRRFPILKNDEVSYIDFIKSYSSEVKVELFEKTGHYITIEKPEIVNKVISEWINKL